jgi:hypothetical protein
MNKHLANIDNMPISKELTKRMLGEDFGFEYYKE